MSKRQTGAAPGATETRKVTSELFTLTYGALVAQLIKDYERDEDVNAQLDKIGYDIGLRLVDDFLAKHPSVDGRCTDLRSVADAVSRHAFRAYLGVTPSVTNWSTAGDAFSLVLDSNPLTEFVELPPAHATLHYSQILCGVMRGALEMLHMEVSCTMVTDIPGSPTELRVKFVRRLEETVPAGED